MTRTRWSLWSAAILFGLLGGAAASSARVSSTPSSPDDVQAALVQHQPAVTPAATCTTPAPSTAPGYARMFDSIPASQWQGADHSESVKLADGRIVWLYADTISTGAPTFVHSTAIVQQAGCFHVANGGAQLIPDAADGSFYWPAGAVAFTNSTGPHLLVSLVHVKAGGPAGFTVLGSAAAILNTPAGADPVFLRMAAGWPNPAPAIAGAGLYLTGTTLHVFTATDVHQTYVFGRALSHRTVALNAAIGGTGTWGVDSTVIPASPDGTDNGVSPYSDAAGFHLLTKRWSSLGQTVLRYDSASPAGPFSAAVTVLTTSQSTTCESGPCTYSAQAHPEAVLASGKLLVTVCHNGPGAFTDPTHIYRPSYSEVAR